MSRVFLNPIYKTRGKRIGAKKFRRILLRKAPRAEHWVYQVLKRLGLSWQKQYAFKGRFYDFYCQQIKCVVEVDGAYHQEESQQLKDARRDQETIDNGLTVIRIDNYNPYQLVAAVDKILQMKELIYEPPIADKPQRVIIRKGTQ